jgi:tetratricopeptide (TPR) repeat protein
LQIWRAEKALKISRYLLDIGLNQLSLGRAHLLQSQCESNQSLTESLAYFNRAVDGLRESGNYDDVPRGLLARAEYYRVTGELNKSQKDLDEVFSISTRGGMGLHLADCHLEYGRLKVERFKVEGSKAQIDYLGEARKHLATAKEMINKMGYHRRDKEVAELERLIGDAGRD